MLMLHVSSVSIPEVPVGKDDGDNIELRQYRHCVSAHPDSFVGKPSKYRWKHYYS